MCVKIWNRFKNKLQNITIFGLEGMSLYNILVHYIRGLIKGMVSSRASSISFSFFMAMFPFLLFILTLIPYIPVTGFQENFIELLQNSMPPKTFEVALPVITDIAKNQYGGLLSFGFVFAYIMMTNGINAIFTSFEYSYHITEIRSTVKMYIVSLGTSILMSSLLILTVCTVAFFEFGIEFLATKNWIHSNWLWVRSGRYFIFVLMVFTCVSLMYRIGTREGKQHSFFSAGAILTTILYVITFYIFGIYVLKFSTYNEIYGSIGTLLLLMLFIWINGIILLLGFELNASIGHLKKVFYEGKK